MKLIPFLSIIIPSYNCAHLLKRAVDSAFVLGPDVVEVIVVDDGSTDNTVAVCSQLKTAYPALKVIRRTNGGLSAARNTGIRHCSGAFVVLLDADDELLPFNPHLIMESNVDVLRIGAVDVSIDGKERIDAHSTSILPGFTYLHDRLNGKSGIGLRVESWAYIYRRSYLLSENLEFPEGLLHEDTSFTIEALLRAQTVAAIETPVYRYIRRAASIMGTQSYTMSQRRIASFAVIHERILYLANTHQDVDLWLWAEHLANVAWRYAFMERSRRLALAVLKIEWRMLTGYRLWGVYRAPRDVRYRLRLAVERVLLGPSERNVKATDV